MNPNSHTDDSDIDVLLLDLDLHCLAAPGSLDLEHARIRVRAWLDERSGPDSAAAPLDYEPQPCCLEYATCQRVCTPRGIEIGLEKAARACEARKLDSDYTREDQVVNGECDACAEAIRATKAAAQPDIDRIAYGPEAGKDSG